MTPAASGPILTPYLSLNHGRATKLPLKNLQGPKVSDVVLDVLKVAFLSPAFLYLHIHQPGVSSNNVHAE
jgi:hypothetical protein